MTELELKIYDIVRSIPEGKVATYKQIAERAGDAHLARVVGNVMHKNPVPYFTLAAKAGFSVDQSENLENDNFLPVPCHRVVNSQGKMGKNFGLGGPSVQAEMLRLEGVTIINNKVDLQLFKF